MRSKMMIEDGSKLDVLYVEDSATARMSLLEKIEGVFRKIDIAQDGKEGLAMYHNHLRATKQYYDLVITDIEVPEINGIKMAEKMMYLNPAQVILIVSSKGDTRHLQAAIDISVAGFISKPYQEAQLFSTLGKIVKNIHEKRENRFYVNKLEELNKGHL
jgi:YesN/AraC family two-component response regulator